MRLNKVELASYLLTLHSLMEAQSKGAYSRTTTALVEEYEKHWGMLKDAIKKEKDDEAGKNGNDDEGPKDRTDQPRGQPEARGEVGAAGPKGSPLPRPGN